MVRRWAAALVLADAEQCNPQIETVTGDSMPKISGREVISETTEKTQGRLLLFAAVAIVAKAYQVPVQDLKFAGMEFPAAIFDVSISAGIVWLYYSYIVKWVGDLIGFRTWYSESSIWSEFRTDMKLDKTFINGGVDTLKAFAELDREGLTDEAFRKLPEDKRKLYDDFKQNAELYGIRLDYAGKKFATVSAFGHFYIWVQGFIIPTGMTVIAVYLLFKYGVLHGPSKL